MEKREKKDFQDKVHVAYQQLEKAYRDLKDAHVEMIFRMALLAEYRDPTTGIHLVRVADYSGITAEGMGLPKEEVEIIRYASPMHDIGKIMLPDSVLKKEGNLTDEERELMKNHPRVAASIFKNAKSPMLEACGVIALSHHERFDGTGYPDALKGEEIPLYGRIVALADCFDAYTSERLYKKAYGFEESVSMVVERAGTHFDPAVVMAFVRNKEKARRIWSANRDIEEFLRDMGVSAEGSRKEGGDDEKDKET